MNGELSQAVTPRELLTRRERAWSHRLRNVSLAAEYQVIEEYRAQAFECLGTIYRRTVDPYERAQVLRRWPAVHVLCTTGVATDHYEAATFWPKLSAAMGTTLGSAESREWGEAFLDNLAALDLPTFDASENAGTRFVGRILMHSGMPTQCLPDFFRLVSERRSKVLGLDAVSFVEWVTARSALDQLRHVPKPVARFLQFGDEFAVDVCDRAFDLLDAVTAGGSGEDIPLPDRFRAVAAELSATGEIRRAPRRLAGQAGLPVEQYPRLVIDPFGQGLVLRLPTVGVAPDGNAVWIVGLDASSRRVPTRPNNSNINEAAPQTDVPVNYPARHATVALAGREDLTMTLSVVEEGDPLLAFGEDGERLPPGLPLPGRATWILFPGDSSKLEADGAIVLSECPLPPGWTDWCLLLVDLESCKKVRVLDEEKTYRTHDVRTFAAARVASDDPLTGVRTSTSHPVVASLPTVHLPDDLSDAHWEVSVIDEQRHVVGRWVSNGTSSDPNSVWDGIPHPVVGVFTVRVRGPWGRGATRTVRVVEGLRASFNPPWRRLVAAGLQRCEATIACADEVEVSQSSLQFSERAVEQHVRVKAQEASMTLLVTPPHMSIAYQTEETTTSPSIKPLQLYREEVSQAPGSIIVNLGGSATPGLRVISGGGVVQEVAPGASRHGIYRFDLSRIIDTLSTYPQPILALDDDGAIVVGRIRPRSLFTGASIVEDTLEFANSVMTEGLTAFVYPTRAPWRDPAAVLVSEARALVPEDLRRVGPLRVMLRIEDPWVPEPHPAWPSIKSSIAVDADGFLHDGDDEEMALSAFLAGAGDLPSSITDFSRLWSVRAMVGGLELGPRVGDVVRSIDEAMLAQPGRALEALGSSKVSDQSVAALTIRTGLAWTSLPARADQRPPAWTGRGALVSALLSTSCNQWSDDEVLAALDVCGEAVVNLARGRDPEPSAGRIDDSADVFDAMPGLRDSFVRQAGLVPRGILSGEARVIAAMEFIKQRRHVDLTFFAKDSHRLLIESLRMIGLLEDPVAARAFHERRHPTREAGWRVIPEISLAFAFAARHSARGHAGARSWISSKQRYWADLAKVAPRLVTTDLIIAELLVSSSGTAPKEM